MTSNTSPSRLPVPEFIYRTLVERGQNVFQLELTADHSDLEGYATIQNARLRDAGAGQLSIPVDGVIRISDEQKAIDRPIDRTLVVAGVPK